MAKNTSITPADVTLGAANSNGEYYRVGTNITVLWMGKHGKYLCMTCRLDHCNHVDVVHEYRHIPAELRSVA
jgi:hypothetical protein